MTFSLQVFGVVVNTSALKTARSSPAQIRLARDHTSPCMASKKAQDNMRQHEVSYVQELQLKQHYISFSMDGTER